MKNILSARFDDRDSADLALMRLRRGGVNFSVSRLYTDSAEKNGRGSGGFIAAVSPYSQNITNPLGASDAAFANLGSRAFLGQVIPPAHGDAVLQISLEQEQLSRARDIIRSAHGRSLRVTG